MLGGAAGRREVLLLLGGRGVAPRCALGRSIMLLGMTAGAAGRSYSSSVPGAIMKLCGGCYEGSTAATL